MIFQGKVGKLELLGVTVLSGWPHEQISLGLHSIRYIRLHATSISYKKCPLALLDNSTITFGDKYGQLMA